MIVLKKKKKKTINFYNKTNFYCNYQNKNIMYQSKLPWRTEQKRTQQVQGARDGVVVRVLASHQCDPGSNPGVDAICGLSLLLVLSLAPRGFSLGTLVFLSP